MYPFFIDSQLKTGKECREATAFPAFPGGGSNAGNPK